MSSSSGTKSAPRTLVLCFDGTSNKYGSKITNVIRIFEALEKTMPEKQVCYYQPGIGTYVAPTKPFAGLLSGVSMVIDKAVAWHLDDHVIGGYQFLMDNYSEGDRICLIGFSRGAYIARCVAGMLPMVGLLPKGNSEQVPFAYSLYKNDSEIGLARAHGFKHAFSRKVQVNFSGVRDSVTSVGLGGRRLPLTSHNGNVKVFRQALALDERRAKFNYNPCPVEDRTGFERLATKLQLPCRIDHPLGQWGPDGVPHQMPPSTAAGRFFEMTRDRLPFVQPKSPSFGCQMCDYEGRKKRAPTDSREVWFAGCHGDVGGNTPALPSTDHNGFSAFNPSLLWMVQQIQKANVDIIWSKSAFLSLRCVKEYPASSAGNPASTLQVPLHPHRPLQIATNFELPPEVKDALEQDVAGPIRDKLSAPWSPWWLLEYVPLRKHYLTKDGERWKRWSVNMGRSRRIHLVNHSFHVFVKLRMDRDREYKPRATWEGSPKYVHD